MSVGTPDIPPRASDVPVSPAVAGGSNAQAALGGLETAVATKASSAGLTAEVAARVAADAAHVAAADPHPQYATDTDVDARITTIIGTATSNLDTLGEIGDQLAADESAVAAIVTTLATKATTAALTAEATTRASNDSTETSARIAGDAAAVQRANHTGTQAAGTITGLATVATSGAYTDLSGLPSLGTAASHAVGDFDAAGAASAATGTALQKASNLSDLGNAGTARTNLGLGTAATAASSSFDVAGAAASAQAAAIQRANHTGTQAVATITGLATVATTGAYSDLSGKPTLGTAAAKDIPASGNASSTQVVYGSDTRLSDSRTPSAHAASHAPGGADAIDATYLPITGGSALSMPATAVTQTPMLQTSDIFGDYVQVAGMGYNVVSGLNVNMPGGKYAVIRGRRVITTSTNLTLPANSCITISLLTDGTYTTAVTSGICSYGIGADPTNGRGIVRVQTSGTTADSGYTNSAIKAPPIYGANSILALSRGIEQFDDGSGHLIFNTYLYAQVHCASDNSYHNLGIGGLATTNGAFSFTNAATTGTIVGVSITPTYNQLSGNASTVDLLINRTQTAVGSGTHRLIDAQISTASKFSVDTTGTVIASNNFVILGGQIQSSNASGSNNPLVIQGGNSNGNDVAGINKISLGGGSSQNSSGTSVAVRINPTINQSSTAAATDLLVSRTATAVGSGSQRSLDCQVGGTSYASIGALVTTGGNGGGCGQLSLSAPSTVSNGAGIFFASNIDVSAKTGLFAMDASGNMIFRGGTSGAGMYYDVTGTGTHNFRVNTSTTVASFSSTRATLLVPLNIPTATPASSSAAGTTGDIAWDASFIYVCTATNTWKRTAITTW